MELTLSTPALLFSTASLLMLGFSNRFMAIAKLIRDLHADYLKEPSALLVEQLKNLRFRVRLVRNMQFLGVMSLFLSILCMIFIYLEMQTVAGWLFGLALLLQAAALAISVYEITISIEGTIPTKVGAINPTCRVKSAPPIEANTAPKQNTNILKLETS